MDNLKFSVVTVCYNSEKEIEKTICSILNQEYAPFEYIVIDGLSSDNTLNILNSKESLFKEKGIRLIVISEKDTGIYNAMNKGIRNASGDFISFLNAGDWYEPSTLNIINKKYNDDKFDLCYGSINYYKKDGKVAVKKSKLDKKFVTSRHWNHPSMFLKTNIYKENLFDETFKIYSDFELFLRIRKIVKTCIIDETLSNFVADGISTNSKMKIVRRRAKEKYRAYRLNKYSKFYFFESYGWEYFKACYFFLHRGKK